MNVNVLLGKGANGGTASGGGVTSVNTATGGLTIAAGSGITVGTAGTTITISATGAGGGSVFLDSAFAIQNSADATKQLEVSLGSMTTGKIVTLSFANTTTATLNVPNFATGDIVATAAVANVFTNKNSFNLGGGFDTEIVGKGSGNAASTAANNTVFGAQSLFSVTTGTGNTSFGAQNAESLTTGSNNVFIGNSVAQTLGATGNSNILIGTLADVPSAGTSNTLVFGAANSQIHTVYIGGGASASAPSALTINATSGLGANVAGAAMALVGGAGTGTGIGGAVSIQTAPIGSSGSTANVPTSRFSIAGDGGISIPGLATGSAPSVSAASAGTLYFNSTTSNLMLSINTAAYVPVMTNPMTTLGDLTYGGNSGVPTRLAGNTTTTNMFLAQVGTGSASAAYGLVTIQVSDIPPLPASSITSGVLGTTYGGLGQNASAAANGAIPIGTSSGLALGVPTGTAPLVVTVGSGTLNISIGTIGIANGGSGLTTTAPYAVFCGGTSSTSAFQQVSGLGSTGNILTSNGTGALPTWQSPAAAVTSVNALTGALNIVAGANITVTPSGSTITITGTGGGGGGGVSSATNNTVASSIGVYDTITGSNLQFKPLVAGSGTILLDGGTGNGITIASGGTVHSVADAAYTMLSTQAEVIYTSITASRTVTLPAASSVNPGVHLIVRDTSGSLTQAINVIISRAGSDTIEGGTVSWTIRTPNGFREFASDGVSNWHLVSMSRDVQFWGTVGSKTWNAEPGAKFGYVECIGGGSGGGGGAQQPSGTASVGGGGGSGGGYSAMPFLVSDAGATQPVVVGAAGTGGAGGATNGSAGSNPVGGGNSSFGVGTIACEVTAVGGIAGTGGGAGTGGVSGPGGYGLNAGWLGGAASTTGGAGNSAQTGYSFAAGAGGSGGGIPTAATPFSFGGHGGSGGMRTSNFGSPGSQGNARVNTDGATGNSPPSITLVGYAIGAPGAAGGSSSILTTGGLGGTGASPGGGGGGGGAALNGHSGGAGGNGGVGCVSVSQGL